MGNQPKCKKEVQKKKPPEGGEKTGNYINAMKHVHAARLRVARRVGYSIDTA
jgi:hypothetical protein